MGCNFYAKCPCKGCEHHLGKSSAGWKFMLQANEFKYYNDWPSMKEWLQDQAIVDEYGDSWTVEAFIEKVEQKQTSASQLRCFDADDERFFCIDGYEFSIGEFS